MIAIVIIEIFHTLSKAVANIVIGQKKTAENVKCKGSGS